ncbi:uncharacterized protein VTP21DRAFT_4802 [Calcarisporiella thermophila]|uniref:uncharacterized protein n=1 Tax=Calcarisporiella thermophila TaxID=911321 RepID=UPI003742933A
MLYQHVLIYLPLTTLDLSSAHHHTIHHSVSAAQNLTILLRLPSLPQPPAREWHQLQSLLCTIYVTASKTANACGRPLTNVDVIFEEWCGYDVATQCENLDTFIGFEQDKAKLDSINDRRALSSLPPLSFHVLPSFPLEEPRPQSQESGEIAQDALDMKHYRVAAVGGTFDHLHPGHKILLTMTAWLAEERLVCGITADSILSSKKYRDFLEPLATRMERTHNFLTKIKRDLRYDITPIYDVYGPTSTDAEIEVLVVSKETEAGGLEVNKERARRGLPQLDIQIIDVVSPQHPALAGEDIKQLKISSTAIRELLYQQQNQQPQRQ